MTVSAKATRAGARASARNSRAERFIKLPIPGPRTLFVVGLAVMIAMGGVAWAQFMATVTVTHSAASGSMTLTAGATGAKTNRFDISATTLAIGDTVQRTLDLTVGGTIATKELDLLLTASPSTLLDTSATGLTILIEKCSVAWTEAGSNPAYTSTCSGSQSTVWAVEAVSVMKARNTFALIPTTVSGTLFLKITLTLPAGANNAADNLFQGTAVPPVGLSSTLSFAFSTVQRVATDK